jgi:prepilin-type N-terminal cleavage/methylation domain-containing protein
MKIPGVIGRSLPTKSKLLDMQHDRSSGFTLVEMTVAMLILTLLVAGIFRFLVFVNNGWLDGYLEQQVMANMQNVQTSMALDIKEAVLNPVPLYDAPAEVNDNGSEIAIFENQPSNSGTVNTSGTTVTLASGDAFNTGWVAGTTITINNVQYTIASVNSTNQLTLASSAPTQNGVAYTGPSNTLLEEVYYYLDNQKQELERTVILPDASGSFSQPDPAGIPDYPWTILLKNVVGGNPYSGTVNTSGTTVIYVSGAAFNTGWPEHTLITINNQQYAIASVNSTTQLTLASPAPTQTGVAYAQAPLFVMNSADSDHPNLSVNVTLECSNPIRPRIPLALDAEYAVRSNMNI